MNAFLAEAYEHVAIARQYRRRGQTRCPPAPGTTGPIVNLVALHLNWAADLRRHAASRDMTRQRVTWG